ncbi:MAG: RNA polymerase sigma factor [Imperialibacter sp.]|uniref:RNA polymerase sigma factor n=1 Tax=Imperialibacter sp. TaxID=2038411 RepID=UPI003A8BD509
MDDFYLQKVLDGDTEAFRYFVSTYKKYAFSMAFAILKNQYLAEEAVQESFIKAFQKLHTFRRESLFKTWLGRIVINESLRKAKPVKIQATMTIDDLPEADTLQVENTMQSIIQADQSRCISMALEKLPAEYALALELFYLQENSISEIRTMSGWSESKVKMLLLRGKKAFYGHLSQLLKSETRELL